MVLSFYIMLDKGNFKMEDNVILSDLFIGNPDGLSEARNKKFDTLFYNKNNKYQLLQSDTSKFIITGRKGTGKTLLGKYYERRQSEDNVFSKYIDKDDVLFIQLQAIGNGNIPQNERAAFSQYAILSQMGKILLDNRNKIINKSSIIKKYSTYKKILKLSKLLKQQTLYGFNLKEISLNNSSSVTGEYSQNSAKINAKRQQDNTKKYEKAPYYQYLDEIQKLIIQLLVIFPIAIIIDDLDEYDEKISENSDFAKFLSKFIEVTYKINIEIVAVSPKSKVVLLFRSDLLKLLHSVSTNLNKFTVNSVINLNWLEKPYTGEAYNNSLMDMLLNKIRVSCPEFGCLDNRELFARMFPPQIKGIDTLKYLLNYSHGRPRDIVNMLNIIIQRYPNEKTFKNIMFLETEAEYSRAFCNELKNEMSLYYESNYIDDCFHTISLIHRNNFWPSDVDKVIASSKNRIPSITDVSKMLEILYKFGIIGNARKVDTNQKKVEFKYSFGYREDGNDIVNFHEKFTIHFALRKELV